MPIKFLIDKFKESAGKDAIIWKDTSFKYEWLLERFQYWKNYLKTENISPGTVTVVEADFSPNAVSLLLALIGHQCIIVPLTSSVEAQKPEFIGIAEGEVLFSLDDKDNLKVTPLPYSCKHDFYKELKRLNRPGLVLFSSGSTGKCKAMVHDLLGILEKFKVSRHCLRSVTFLLFDHIGGINTLLYVLSNGGCLITLQSREPDEVLRTIEKFKGELLPTSPTFINLILLSEAYKRYDMNSLKLVTYGTEPMPESTLKRFHEILPGTRLLQTYGLSEIGIMRTKSKSSNSLWVKVGGEGFQTRVVDGILQVKAQSAMMGYLNAQAPFTEDGWFITGDEVEIDGGYLKILGRRSEIINVGGEKVCPAEVESLILEMDNVSEVTVYSESNPIIGNIVCAKVRLNHQENPKEFSARLKSFCRDKLQAYKIPVKVNLKSDKQYSERFKKRRVEN